MSTRINSTVSDRSLYIENNPPGEVSLALEGDGKLIDLDRAEFLAAVARELDVIVIPRTDLPNVTDRYGLLTAINGTQSDSATTSNEPDQLRRKALNILALAEHLEQNPPIDEAAVDDLANVIRDTNLGHRLTMGDVRALVRAGVRVDGAK